MSAPQVETSVSSVEKIKLWLVAFLLLATAVGYYFFADQAALRFPILFGGVAVALAVFFAMTDAGKSLINYARESRKEMYKVVWPTRKEAFSMTLYVFGFVVLVSVFLWLTDKILGWGIYGLILGWR